MEECSLPGTEAPVETDWSEEVDKCAISDLKIFSFLNFCKIYLILLRKILRPPSFSEDRIQLKFYLYLLSLNY